MTKRLLIFMLSMLLLVGVAPQAMASNEQDNQDISPIEYIQSEKVSKLITENIRITGTGTQSIYVGNGIMFTAEVSTADVVPVMSNLRGRFATASGRFYTESDNKTVAEFSLSAAFEFDNFCYVGLINSPIISSETVSDDWRLDGICEELHTVSQCIVSGQWTLYHKEGFIWKKYQYNNNSHIDIICTPRGEITYDYKQ